MKGPDDMPAPAREAHKHACGDWCFCWIPDDPDCQKCRHAKASARMREEHRQRNLVVDRSGI
jgi:hypothetical protein